MKTEIELNAAILKITLHIQNTYPELCKYLEEMPVTIPNPNPEISIKTLTDYYNSLEVVLKKYAVSHSIK